MASVQSVRLDIDQERSERRFPRVDEEADVDDLADVRIWFSIRFNDREITENALWTCSAQILPLNPNDHIASNNPDPEVDPIPLVWRVWTPVLQGDGRTWFWERVEADRFFVRPRGAEQRFERFGQVPQLQLDVNTQEAITIDLPGRDPNLPPESHRIRLGHLDQVVARVLLTSGNETYSDESNTVSKMFEYLRRR